MRILAKILQLLLIEQVVRLHILYRIHSVIYLEPLQLKRAQPVFHGNYQRHSMLKFQIQNQVGGQSLVIPIVVRQKLVLVVVDLMFMLKNQPTNLEFQRLLSI